MLRRRQPRAALGTRELGDALPAREHLGAALLGRAAYQQKREVTWEEVVG